MPRARPTLRALTDDLRLAIPPVDQPLDEIAHPLLDKARDQFADLNSAQERISAIDDEVVLKVKVQRWRGGVWYEQKAQIPWLIAAGGREEGSPDDFYAALAARGAAERARYNAAHPKALTTKTYIGSLLPGADDRKRYALEEGTRQVRQVISVIRSLTRGSLRDGHEHAVDFPEFRLGIATSA